jgi:ABC-type transporter Mla MlaB component
MLRITMKKADGELVFKLEGCLAGPWVEELDALWREQAGGRPGRRVRVDMRDVCHVDGAGRALMTRMYLAGTEYQTTGCVMPEIVREISESADARGSKRGGSNRV